MESLFIFWIIAVVVALSLDILVYIVLRREWEKRGFTMIDELSEQISNKLGQVGKTWRERLSIKLKPAALSKKSLPVIEAQQVQLEPEFIPVAEPIQVDEPQSEPIAASVKTVGGLQRVEFSMDVPLNRAIRISIASTPETGVKVEKREL